jgi:pimeloyl-ACP methyl ester carboxylesterase
VLLLPTWSLMHSRHWKMQIPYLARHCRVVTFDGRGNGRSDRPQEAGAYDEREFAADALAVLDATETERAVIVGFSLGGQRGLLLAAEQPERIEGAVFIGPRFVGGGEPLPERTVYDFDTEYETYEGWAKHNRFHWLRDYRDWVEFFISKMFTEPHSTKAIEDAVGWGLETDGEIMLATQDAPGLTPEESQAL